MLLLNVQPGRSDFLTEVKTLDRWLAEPDVGLALDPEWAMGPGQIPGRTYGSTTGKELNAVGAHVAAIVKAHDLPQKAIIYHQVAVSVVKHESDLKSYPGVAWVKSVDGIGSRAEKTNTYNVVNQRTPDFVHAGFKLFFHEDQQHGSADERQTGVGVEARAGLRHVRMTSSSAPGCVRMSAWPPDASKITSST